MTDPRPSGRVREQGKIVIFILYVCNSIYDAKIAKRSPTTQALKQPIVTPLPLLLPAVVVLLPDICLELGKLAHDVNLQAGRRVEHSHGCDA